MKNSLFTLTLLTLKFGPPLLAHDAATALDRLQKKIKASGDFVERKVERRGDQTIVMEMFVDVEVPFETSQLILKDYTRYSHWVLAGVNERPDGGSYRISVLGLQVQQEAPVRMELHSRFDLAIFHHESRRIFEFIYPSDKDRVCVVVKHIPHTGSFLDFANYELSAFRSPKDPQRTWIYGEGTMRLKSSLLYQALPIGVLQRETNSRLERIVENFVEESRVRSSKLNQSPRGKKAAPGATAPPSQKPSQAAQVPSSAKTPEGPQP